MITTKSTKYFISFVLMIGLFSGDLAGCTVRNVTNEEVDDEKNADADGSTCGDGEYLLDSGIDHQDADDEFDADGELEDGGLKPDYDESENFLLIVPLDMSLCSSFSQGRTWQEEQAMLGRIDLRPGYYLLPRQECSFEADFVTGIWFGGNWTSLDTGADEGTFEASSGGSHIWYYHYTTEYLIEDVVHRIDVCITIYIPNGNWPAEIVLDADFMSSLFGAVVGKVSIGPGQHQDEVQSFVACDYPPDIEGRETIAATDSRGNSVTLKLFPCGLCGCTGSTTCKYLSSATVLLDNIESFVSNPLQLIYSAKHHNMMQNFFIIIEPAVQEVAAVLVDEFNRQFVYFDADQDELFRDEIVEYKITFH